MGNVESLRVEQIGYETGFGVSLDNGREAVALIDNIITKAYLPFRGAESYGTERAIYLEPPYARHRENDAEHSWCLAITVQAMWDNRENLGMVFPEGFDISWAIQASIAHDFMEIWAKDVDLATPNKEQVMFKASRERVAKAYVQEALPYLAGIALMWEEYASKNSAEARFVSDIDKMLGVRQIFLDGGKKWHCWEGYSINREKHEELVKSKLLTPAGLAMFAATDRDFDEHPEVFPEHSGYLQGSLF